MAKTPKPIRQWRRRNDRALRNSPSVYGVLPIQRKDVGDVRATRFWIEAAKVHVETEDGRIAAVPIAWYPRLAGASEQDLRDFKVMGGGRLIHWPQFEEAFRVETILLGIQGVPFLGGVRTQFAESPEDLGRVTVAGMQRADNPAAESWLWSNPAAMKSVHQGLKDSAEGRTRRITPEALAEHEQAAMDKFAPALRALATGDTRTEMPQTIQDPRPVEVPQAALESQGTLARAKGWSEGDLADWIDAIPKKTD